MNPQTDQPKWTYEIKKKAQRQLEKLAPKDQTRVFRSIEELIYADNPAFVQGVKHLEGSDPKRWRQRQGDYRIIFSLEAGEMVEMNLIYKGRLIIHEIAIHHTGY